MGEQFGSGEIDEHTSLDRSVQVSSRWRVSDAMLNKTGITFAIEPTCWRWPNLLEVAERSARGQASTQD